MTTIEANEGFKRDLKEKISAALGTINFQNGNISIGLTYDSVEKQVLVWKKDYLHSLDPYKIYLNIVYEYSKKFSGNDISGNFDEIVDEHEKNKLVDTILNFYDSIPRDYSIFLHLPQLSGQNCHSLTLTKNLKCIEVIHNLDDTNTYRTKARENNPNIYSTMLSLVQGKESLGLGPGTYLKLSLKGYSDNHLNSPVLTEAVEVLKQFLFLLYIDYKVSFSRVYGLFGTNVEGSIYLSDESVTDTSPTPIELPENFRSFLGKVCVPPQKDSDTSEEISELVEYFNLGRNKEVTSSIEPLQKIKEILNSSYNNPNTAPIKNALVWAFDSQMNSEDIKTSFFQISVALEAILGVNTKNNNKTVQLANRCAYLIGNSVTQRDEIIKQFEEFYKVRSELVHGGKISEESYKWLHWGQQTFRNIVRRELFLAKFE